MVESVILDGTEFTQANFSGDAYANPDTGILAFGAAVVNHGANLFEGESTTSLTIGPGTKIAEMTAARPIFPTAYVMFVDAANASNYMGGEVDSYDKVTGDISFTVTSDYAGSGTIADWLIYCQGKRGATGDPGDIASQAEAEAGENNTKVMTPLRVAEAISARAGFAVRATVTSATTLTAADNNLVPVAMTADSQSVTLPNATTLTAGKAYCFTNTGPRPFGVRNHAGGLIATVGRDLTVTVYLLDGSTAAGAWFVDSQDALLPLVTCDATLGSSVPNVDRVGVRLADTLSLHFCRNSSGHPFVFAIDHSTFPATVGDPALIVASSATIDHAFRVGAAKALILVNGGTAYNVSVSGTTCTPSSSATAAVFDAVTFTGPPLVAALSDTLYVGIDLSAGAVRAQVIDAVGTNPAAGASFNIVASGGQQALAAYAVTSTRFMAFWIDDSGTGGTPYSIRGQVFDVNTGTLAITAPGSSAGVNDVVSSVVLPTVQLTATSYMVGYYQASGTLIRAVHFGVTGTTVEPGTPATVETVSLGDLTYALLNATRFQPNLYRRSDTSALMTYGLASGTTPSRHVVINNSAGTLTPGTIFYGLWTDAAGGNFPQRADGFLTFSTDTAEHQVNQATITGTDIAVTGTVSAPGAATLSTSGTLRFGLSGNYFGIATATVQAGRLLLYRSRPGGPPQYLGAITLPNIGWGGYDAVPLEIAANKFAIIGPSLSQAGTSTALVRLLTLEFPLL